jgi:hypothetical protein
MGLGGWLQRLIGRPADDVPATLDLSGGELNPQGGGSRAAGSAHEQKPPKTDQETAAAWLAAFESGRLNPPKNIRDAAGWDTYWKNHLEVGAPDQGFSDMMSSDDTLMPLLSRRGVRSILCAGNGLSGEALALAMCGFDVVALDISAVPTRVFSVVLRSETHPINRVPGFSVIDDNTFRFTHAGPIDAALCPTIHQNSHCLPKGGGSLTFAVGDLLTPGVCAGPFDAVIERRTVQLFPEHDRPAALEQLSARLAGPGVFISHQHAGAWKPGQPRTHYAESWVRSHGYAVRSHLDPSSDIAARLAYLMYSTG